MDAGLEIRVLWFDEDVLKVRVSASNGVYSGAADAYIELQGLQHLAKAIERFPLSHLDRREAILGTFSNAEAGGGARLVFRCVDRSAHAVLDLSLRNPRAQETDEASQFSLRVEPAAIDRFAACLATMSIACGEKAWLESAT